MRHPRRLVLAGEKDLVLDFQFGSVTSYRVARGAEFTNEKPPANAPGVEGVFPKHCAHVERTELNRTLHEIWELATRCCESSHLD
jgi:hypothetical protein